MSWLKWSAAGAGLFVAAGVIAFGAVSLGGGSASAQVALQDNPGHYSELLAQKLGISVAQLQAAEKAARDQMIDEAVTAGRLTPDQATKLKSQELGALRGGLPGHGGRGVVQAVKSVVEAAAKVIGITPQAAHEGLANGKSLAQLAQEKSVSRSDLKSGIVTEVKAQLAEAVKNGHLTQIQADKLLEGLNQRLDEAIDRTGGDRPERMMPNGGNIPQFRPRTPNQN